MEERDRAGLPSFILWTSPTRGFHRNDRELAVQPPPCILQPTARNVSKERASSQSVNYLSCTNEGEERAPKRHIRNLELPLAWVAGDDRFKLVLSAFKI